ncbi:hypothetical protein PC110_g608 [Phytophthora cactorum]|uniref:PiggyBac transposable element-derived protein domain-containing protein n=1 Tax=Phytophthora cactorum TaxID=29920 RepID=A0A329T5J8_9STRA|nr:hypothetical protein PC110_g608 [Phytophthora cactorum]
MQGVDKLDQIRGIFLIADGHFFKKWHKTLALAMIDIARSNAYLMRRLVKADLTARDPHRKFVMDLVCELMNGKWTEAPSEGRMVYGTSLLNDVVDVEDVAPTPVSPPSASGPVRRCTAVAAKQIHDKKNRKRRRCVVCRWEDRYPTEVTTYCLTHRRCSDGLELGSLPPKEGGLDLPNFMTDLAAMVASAVGMCVCVGRGMRCKCGMGWRIHTTVFG